MRNLLSYATFMVMITGFTLLGCNAVFGDNNKTSVSTRDITPSVNMHTGVQPYESETPKTDEESSADSPQYSEGPVRAIASY